MINYNNLVGTIPESFGLLVELKSLFKFSLSSHFLFIYSLQLFFKKILWKKNNRFIKK